MLSDTDFPEFNENDSNFLKDDLDMCDEESDIARLASMQGEEILNDEDMEDPGYQG